MKSEKARQELEDGSWKVEVGYEGEDVDSPYHAVRVDVAQYAVELAEQEAEERMREKAKRAFECVWNATPKQVAEECGISIQEINNEAAAMKYCHQLFIQKLTQNGNDRIATGGVWDAVFLPSLPLNGLSSSENPNTQG